MNVDVDVENLINKYFILDNWDDLFTLWVVIWLVFDELMYLLTMSLLNMKAPISKDDVSFYKILLIC